MTPPPFIYSRIPGLLKLVSLGHLNFSMRGRIHLLLRVIMAVFSLLQNGTGLSFTTWVCCPGVGSAELLSALSMSVCFVVVSRLTVL